MAKTNQRLLKINDLTTVIVKHNITNVLIHTKNVIHQIIYYHPIIEINDLPKKYFMERS